VKDWVEWHAGYDSAHSSLSRRLVVVKSSLHQALEAPRRDPAVLLSLCAGDGRDVISVLKERPVGVRQAVLVELNQTLASRAKQEAMRAGLMAVHVRCRDAGTVDSFSDLLPVDVLMLCGIFGNLEHAQVKAIIDVVPRLVTCGGFVIWTRGSSEPDPRPEIRHWFELAGLEEIAFAGAPEPYGVGLNRSIRAIPTTGLLPDRLFTVT
jgi:hypothetical protein